MDPRIGEKMKFYPCQYMLIGHSRYKMRVMRRCKLELEFNSTKVFSCMHEKYFDAIQSIWISHRHISEILRKFWVRNICFFMRKHWFEYLILFSLTLTRPPSKIRLDHFKGSHHHQIDIYVQNGPAKMCRTGGMFVTFILWWLAVTWPWLWLFSMTFILTQYPA